MGKPFAAELADLQETYAWCMAQPLGNLELFVTECTRFPLIAVGSGGSLSAAHFATLLHQQHGALAKAVTPLDLYATPSAVVSEAAVLFVTAGGSNPDIISGFEFAALTEPRSLAAACMRKGSPLFEVAERYRYSLFFEVDLPCGKDGFLATNSLLALMIMLTRAYEQYTEPATLPSVLLPEQRNDLSEFREKLAPILDSETLLVLYGGWGLPIAVDLESKFSEAALGNVHVADYRNFGHGRHHWLAKRPSKSAVVALVTPGEEIIARKTLALLPKAVPSICLQTKALEAAGSIELYVQMLHLVQQAGLKQGIDPGRPGVPEFGRRLYHLRHRPAADRFGSMPIIEEASIQRKCRPRTLARLTKEELLSWRIAYSEFLIRLYKAKFTGIVLDYDGTLCDKCDRYSGLRKDVAGELIRLLKSGITLGIATGRGGSAREVLRPLIPTELHQQVLIGYYNGAAIYPLSEKIKAEDLGDPVGELQVVANSLRADIELGLIATIHARKSQITVEANLGIPRSMLLDKLESHVRSYVTFHGQMLESSHSVDILAPGISKQKVIESLHRILSTKSDGSSPDILCIGDRGRWPGNDYALLEHHFSLSVDEVSSDPVTCWNIAPPGHRGVQATLGYLTALVPRTSGGLTFAPPLKKASRR